MHACTHSPSCFMPVKLGTVYQRHARKLNHFHTSSLGRILDIKWQDKIPDTEVLAQAGLASIHTVLMQSQLQRADHVACNPDWVPNTLSYGELQEGKRSQGGQKTFERQCEDLRESVCHQPQYLGTHCSGPC